MTVYFTRIVLEHHPAVAIFLRSTKSVHRIVQATDTNFPGIMSANDLYTINALAITEPRVRLGADAVVNSHFFRVKVWGPSIDRGPNKKS